MDLDLVLRAQQGDQDAFGILAGRAIAGLYRTARLILRDDDMARDAVQESLVRAWLHIRALRDGSRFEAWARRILLRICVEESDRFRRRRIHEINVEGAQWIPGPRDRADVALRDQVDRALRSLTPAHRAVLVVHHYLDLSDGEAAEALGIRIGTYKSRLHRASAAFRSAMEADERRENETVESLA